MKYLISILTLQTQSRFVHWPFQKGYIFLESHFHSFKTLFLQPKQGLIWPSYEELSPSLKFTQLAHKKPHWIASRHPNHWVCHWVQQGRHSRATKLTFYCPFFTSLYTSLARSSTARFISRKIKPNLALLWARVVRTASCPTDIRTIYPWLPWI